MDFNPTRMYSSQRLQALAMQINDELHQPENKLAHSPLSLLIVRESGYLNKLPLFVAMKTRLRFSDLQCFNLNYSAGRGIFEIIQSKTNKKILRSFIIHDYRLRSELVLFHHFTQLVNYSSLFTEIERIKKRFLSSYKLDFNSNLHIFRHLDATFMNNKGVSIEDISKELGNSKNAVSNFYIHDIKIPNIIS